MSVVRALTNLKTAFPRADFPEATIMLYAEQLADLDEAAVEHAVTRLIRRATYLPTIGEIRHEVAEAQLGLPTPAEAWDIAVSGSLRNAPPEVRASADAVGGRWGILRSSQGATTRSQFLRDYTERRETTIQTVMGARVPLALPTGPALAVTMAALPQTTRMHPRPVLLRLAKRMAGRTLDPPTEEEKADAIAVLRDGPSDLDNPENDSLYREAEAIHREAGE